MAAIGECCCCCYQCSQGLSTKDDPFYHLKFESLSGLHPLSFENDLYVASKCNRTSGGTYGGFNPAVALPPDLPRAKVNFGCTEDYLTSFVDDPVLWTAAQKMSESIEACCFIAFTAPADGECKSAGTTGVYEYSDEFAYTIEGERNSLPCYPGGIRHIGPDTYTHRLKSKESMACRRRLEGVVIKACYVNDAYGIRKLELTATVTYKDHVKSVSDYSYARKVDYAARGAEYQDLPGGCSMIAPAAAAYTQLICGSFAAFTYQADATIPDRAADCVCVSTSTSGTCTTETIVRKIFLDPDCTIKGTHVFASGLAPTAKVRIPCSCPLSSLFTCYGWPYVSVNCSLNSPVIRNFETAYYIVDGVLAWEELIITTPSSPSTAVSCASQPTLMNWWTEDWTITIS